MKALYIGILLALTTVACGDKSNENANYDACTAVGFAPGHIRIDNNPTLMQEALNSGFPVYAYTQQTLGPDAQIVCVPDSIFSNNNNPGGGGTL